MCTSLEKKIYKSVSLLLCVLKDFKYKLSPYPVHFPQLARCDTCGHEGKLSQSLPLPGEVKHFCDIKCLLHFCHTKRSPSDARMFHEKWTDNTFHDDCVCFSCWSMNLLVFVVKCCPENIPKNNRGVFLALDASLLTLAKISGLLSLCASRTSSGRRHPVVPGHLRRHVPCWRSPVQAPWLAGTDTQSAHWRWKAAAHKKMQKKNFDLFFLSGSLFSSLKNFHIFIAPPPGCKVKEHSHVSEGSQLLDSGLTNT